MSKHAKSEHVLGNRTYDVLKYVVEIILPAVGTLYFALAGIWGLPAAEQVVGTVVAVVTFLGVLLGLSRRSYNRSDAKFDGTVDVEENEDGVKVASLNLKNYEDPVDVVNQNELRFKVHKGF